MKANKYHQTAPISKTNGKVYVEKPHLLEDIIQTNESSPKPKRYMRTEIIERKNAHNNSNNQQDDRGYNGGGGSASVNGSIASESIQRRKQQQPQPSSYNNNNHHDQQQQLKSPPQTIDFKIRKAASNPHAEAVERMREKREKAFPLLLENVDKANAFLEGVDKEMALAEEAKRNKIRRQFEEWNLNVHGEIQKTIQKTLNNIDKTQLNKKKNADYQKFLNVTNRKAAIFRDIIIESEYDPLEPNRHAIQAKVNKLQDPVKIAQLKAEREGSMLGESSAGSKVNKRGGLSSAGGGYGYVTSIAGKDTLPVEQWAAGKIEATPYGTFAKMMDSKNHSAAAAGSPESSSSKSATMRSHIVFDHFSYPTNKASIDQEMPRGKRIYPEKIYADPSRVFAGQQHLSEAAKKEIAEIKLPENMSMSNFV